MTLRDAGEHDLDDEEEVTHEDILKAARRKLRDRIEANELSAKDLHALVIEEIKLEQLKIGAAERAKDQADPERAKRARSALTPHRPRMTRAAIG